MDITGLDLHKRESQLCMKAEDGTITERRIATARERFTAVLGSRPRSRILLESATESEWVARHLESLGHEVIVADPNYAPMYTTRSRRVKTDRRDARTLMDACATGAYRAAHRMSDARRHLMAQLALREALVRTRTRSIGLAKAFVRSDGLRVRSSSSEQVAERIADLPLDERLTTQLAPLFALVRALNTQIATLDAELAHLARADADVRRLMTMPSIGVITAAAVVAAIDDVHRFHTAHAFEAYLGLVPRERSSGEKRQLGRITKAGNHRVRWLLVEAGWRVLRSTDPETRGLRAWGHRIAARRGKRIAAVALARRIAGILYATWRDDAPYQSSKLRVRSEPAAAQVS